MAEMRRAVAASEANGRQEQNGQRAIRQVSAPLQPPPGSDMGGRLVLGQGSRLAALNPFVALMHDDVPPWVMFPMHQHRGVEIVTYGLGGALHHEDSLGNAGTVVACGVERNLFGRGFSHSEAPVGGEHYLGLQLFILLSPSDQQLEPSFQLLAPADVPEVVEDGSHVRVIAGDYTGRRSPLNLRNSTLYLDVQLAPGATTALPVPADFQGFAYVLSGQGHFGTPPVPAAAHQRLLLDAGNTLRVTAADSTDVPLRFVHITGRPIHLSAPERPGPNQQPEDARVRRALGGAAKGCAWLLVRFPLCAGSHCPEVRRLVGRYGRADQERRPAHRHRARFRHQGGGRRLRHGRYDGRADCAGQKDHC
jgi:redox-sensitive bicupin YhaK (pirin superfamily)